MKLWQEIVTLAVLAIGINAIVEATIAADVVASDTARRLITGAWAGSLVRPVCILFSRLNA